MCASRGMRGVNVSLDLGLPSVRKQPDSRTVTARERHGMTPIFSYDEMSKVNLSGRVALVTGGSAGLGRQTAASLGRAGALTVLGCRDEAKGQRVCAELRVGAPGARFEVLPLNLCDRVAVRAAAREFSQRYGRLHILVCNAGVPAGRSPVTLVQGVEECFAVNHLAHFALVLELLPLLKASGSVEAPSRIVHVSSKALRFAPTHTGWLSLDFLNNGGQSSMMQRYAMAKLAQLAFSNELDRRLRAEAAPVLSNAIHPGVVATGFVTDNARRSFGPLLGALVGCFVWLRNLVAALSVEDGALTQLYAAASPAVRSGGQYFVPVAQVVRAPHPLATDPAFGAALWDLSVALS